MIPDAGNYHVGRDWTGHEIEDSCPCPKGPCGLVHGPLDTCPEHGVSHTRTIRQAHHASTCPADDDPCILDATTIVETGNRRRVITCVNPGHSDRDCPAERDLFASP
jgi:hypothetical protein